MVFDRELFETRHGRVIMDEELSDKMYLIKSYHPEKSDETSSGFEWSEMERHPEWFDRKSTSSGFMIYWGLKMKEVL